jgi:hypothetical protein
MYNNNSNNGGYYPQQHQHILSQMPPSMMSPNYNYVTGPDGNPAIYSHSTITRTAGPITNADGMGGEGSQQPSVYIQNNYYTLPPGAEIPPASVGEAPASNGETYQQQQQQQQHAPFAYPGGTAWEPSYPGPTEDGQYGGSGM